MDGRVEASASIVALEIRLLGEFQARDTAGRPLVVKARKNRALLAALALAPSGSMPRESLASLLWGDRGETQARGSLRQALAALRKDFATVKVPLFFASDVKVRFDLARADVDVVSFQRDAASNDVVALRRAAALYRGELLADTYVRDAAFEQWLAAERRRLADIASNVLEKLCALEIGLARIAVAKRLVAFDPLREASHRKLMLAYSEAGENGLAFRQYEICREMLREELGVAPGEETEALRRRLLSSSLEPGKAGLKRDDAGVAGRLEAQPPPAGKPSLAVLPLDAMGGDAEVESFSDGLTEDIITGLSRISSVKVIARSTMFAYKGRSADIRSVGRELGARYVLEGSVRRSGSRLRVSAQLIEAESGHHLWAEQIDRVHSDMFDLQDDFTKSIVASVQTQIILNEGRISAEGAEHVSRLLAQSWQLFLGLTAHSLADCKALAERVLALDEKSGMAHRMLAIALYHQAYMGFIPWTEQVIDELYAHAKISVESDDVDEYCHWALGCGHLLKKQHERTVASFKRALEINPNCSLAYGSMGTVLAWSGQFEDSIKSNELALRINPQDPSNFFRHFGLALAHYLASRYDKALPHAYAVAQTRPTWWLGQIIHAASLAQIGRHDEACRIVDELKRARPAMTSASLAVLPFARARDYKHLVEGLRKAGLSERAESDRLA